MTMGPLSRGFVLSGDVSLPGVVAAEEGPCSEPSLFLRGVTGVDTDTDFDLARGVTGVDTDFDLARGGVGGSSEESSLEPVSVSDDTGFSLAVTCLKLVTVAEGGGRGRGAVLKLEVTVLEVAVGVIGLKILQLDGRLL